MVIFEILLNGEIVARGGAADLCVLSQTLTASGVLGEESLGTKGIKDGYKMEAQLSGLTARSSSPSNVHQVWYTSRPLSIGDELTVRIVDKGETSSVESLPTSKS